MMGMRSTIAPTGAKREGLPGGNEALQSARANFGIDDQTVKGMANIIEFAIEATTGAYGGWKAYQQYDHRRGILKEALFYMAELKLMEKTWKKEGYLYERPEIEELLEDVVKLRDSARKAIKEASHVSKSVEILKKVVLRSDRLTSKIRVYLSVSDELRVEGLQKDMLRTSDYQSTDVMQEAEAISSN